MFTLEKPATTFLDAVLSPAELKHLSNEQIQSLAREIREELISNLAKTGGHLASNLGIVEITLALHKVFETPIDSVLWDVGHQCYIHKMLTGRRHKFSTLRQFKGLSGFINPSESDHDAFIAGHSSTSVSLAVGMAIARDHLRQNHKVIAVIGDGGLTGGMALEALNHLGHIQRDVIIILNDNEMSISENVGGFSQYMKRIKETFFYKDLKQKLDLIEDRLDRVQLTPAVWDLILSVKKQAKERFDTPGIVFEKLGINYSGPVDGHDVGALVNAFNAVKDKHNPQIIHVITQKGRGYAPAEDDAIKYHGVPAFSLEPTLKEKVEPGKPKAKTYSDVFTQTLIETAKVEPNLVAITPATAEGSGLVKFENEYPDRFFDVAICEQHAVTMAAGMAKAGLKPVVSIYSTFLQRAMDQVIHDVAIMNLPVVFGVDRGGLVEDGETHQGVFDIAYMRAVPNVTVAAPKDAQELRNIVYTAIFEGSGPVAVRFPRDKAIDADVVTPLCKIDFRKWELVHAGAYQKMCAQSSYESDSPVTGRKHVVILAVGSMVEAAKKALPLMQAAGLNATIFNARSIKPLDATVLAKLVNDQDVKLVTIEEGCTIGGFGSAVLEFAAQERVKTPRIKKADVVCLGIPDNFMEHGSRTILLDLCGLSPEKISKFVLDYWRC
jgi:1-deoxy-D-xylulose-5-phosphate synthase